MGGRDADMVPKEDICLTKVEIQLLDPSPAKLWRIPDF